MMVGTIDFDAVLELCQHEHRRLVLGVLAEERRAMSVGELAEAVGAPEGDAAPRDGPEAGHDRIRAGLHHRHLPRLEAVGLVEYDDGRNVVELTDEFDRVEPSVSAVLEAGPAVVEP